MGQNASGEVTSMRQLMPVLIDGLGRSLGFQRPAPATRPPTICRSICGIKDSISPRRWPQVDPEDYYLIGWRDNMGCAAGSKIRVLVAVKKD